MARLKGLQFVGDFELGLGLGAQLVDGDALGDLDQSHARPMAIDLEDSQLGDDHVDHSLAGQRQFALVQDLGLAVLVQVIHGHDDLQEQTNDQSIE